MKRGKRSHARKFSESWKDAGYREGETPFGTDYQKVSNAVIDYLFFATQNTAGLWIVNDIFRKYGQP